MTALTLNKADLEFVLRQIKIAEGNSTAHSGATAQALTQIWVDAAGNVVPPGTQGAALAIPDPHVPYGLRTVDGTYSNLVPGREHWGAADNSMPRLLDPSYVNDTDGDSIDFDGPVPGSQPPFVNGNYGGPGSVVDADPRTISNLVVDMSLNNPAAIMAALTFAGSEDPMGDLQRILDARVTQAEADAAVVSAQAGVASAEAALDTAITGYTPGDPSTFNAIQTAAAALTAAEAALTHAEQVQDQVALDPYGPMKAVAEELGVVFSENGSLVIPNVAPDEGLTAPFNAWMTFFGQFFDHGLDLISKGGNGTIYVPLQPDDPLITHGPDGIAGNGDEVPPHMAFMALTRATPTEDGSQNNITTSVVDQNQTYTSHASHQVFLREYVLVGGKPVATGKLLTGEDGGLATWADVKHQAESVLGIKLSDLDVLNVPLLLTDAYGEFIRSSTGFPQVVTGVDGDGNLIGVSGSLPTALDLATTPHALTNHAFLDDIAHNAAPGLFDSNGDHIPDSFKTPDSDNTASSPTDAQPFGTYDDELLNRHYITGDGRGNENIGLTAVHHIFHSEHNRQVDAQKLTILRSGDVAFIEEWLSGQGAVDFTGLPSGFDTMSALDQLAYANSLSWDGERLFQAARFATEMQYQHLVFEEFARKIQPAIDVFVFNNITDVDPSIFSEFANTVYRFGHSMLTEGMPRIDANGNALSGANDLDLVEAFLNPVAFDNGGAVSHDEAAAAIVRGMTITRGNEIDEFVVNALRNNLLGLPLDLAAINIARGRDTGIPTLNDARDQLYDASGSTFLKPYDSWVDFAANLKNPLSVVNFIAAYGTHDSVTNATTLEAKRDAAWKLVFGDDTLTDPTAIADWNAERAAFLNSTGPWTAENSGLNAIDLWIGGLAEKKMPFGGMLGSTFNAIFELQLENLQDGDRLYYLTRTQGQNFLNMLEQNSFAKLIMANTNLALPGADGIRGTADDEIPRHIGVDSFANYDFVLEVNEANQADYNGADPGKDPTGNDPVLESLGLGKVQRDNPATPGADTNFLRFTGGEHVVVGGTNNNDTIITDFGDDGIWGDAGDDRIESGAGVDLVNGGAGDDIITDSGDSGDFLKGDEGNDVMANSNGLDIVMGGSGKDVVFVGVDSTEVFAGEGDDFVIGGDGADFILGNEGDDWMEGGGGFDTIAGDNSELFFNSAIKGHDVMFAGGDEMDFDAESGDDIMVQGESVMRNEGMFGFDWAIFKDMNLPVNADLRVPIFTTEQADILRNRFDKVEALSGWKNNDTLLGDDRTFGTIAPGDTVATTEGIFFNDGLDQAGIDRIDGLNQIVSVGPTGFFESGNILLGGAGSDSLRGNGGDDILDGDRWLNVRIRITAAGNVANTQGNEIATVDSLKHVFSNDASIPEAWRGKSLYELMIARTIKPEQLHIVREILTDGVSANDVDVAHYNDIRANYTIVRNADGSTTITHNTVSVVVDPITGRNLVSDGVDTLRNVEIARFSDGVEVRLDNDPPTDIRWNGVAPGNNALPGVNAVIANLSSVDPDSTSWTYSLQAGSSPNFTVSPAGVVTRTGSAMAANTTYTLVIRSTDEFGNFRNETFTIMTGSDANNTITVAVANDAVVYGDDGNDALTGGAGNDTLFGQDEDDTLIGGLGDDVLHGGAGDTDTASYAGATGSVTVNLASGLAAGAAGNDTLIDIENVTGGAFDDVLTGNGGANTLIGGAGNDTLQGGADDDSLQGGADNDTYIVGVADGDDAIQEAGGADTISVVGGGAALAALNFAEGGGGDLVIDVGASQVTVTDHYATAPEEVETVTFDDGTTYAGYALTGTYAMSADDVGNRDAAAGVSSILAGSAAGNTLNGSTGRDLLFGNGGNDTLNGGGGDDLLVGGTGNDTISGGTGNDTIVVDIDGDPNENDTLSGGGDVDTLFIMDGGGNGGETLTASFNGTRITQIEGAGTINADIEQVVADLAGGADTLAYTTTSAVTVDLAAGTASGFTRIANIENVTGGSGNDTFTGDAASNTFSGGTGTDTVILPGTAGDYIFGVTGGNLTVTNRNGLSGTDTLVSIEQLRIGGQDQTIVTNSLGNVGQTLTGGTGAQINRSDVILGFGGNDVLNGNGGSDSLFGGTGDDTINGGAGDDTAVWSVGDGRDLVDGGTEDTVGDTFVVNGDGTSEVFRIWTRAAALGLEPPIAGITGLTAAGLNSNTEIIITRNTNGVGGAVGTGQIIAELRDIEEIVVNPGGGANSIIPLGNFAVTSLNPDTITVNGGAGNDTVDVSSLQSAHRILFRSNGGNDTIIGTLRPQDVVELAPGQDRATYTLVDNGDGTHTFTNGTHSIKFTGPVPPQFQNTPPPGGDVTGAFEYTASDLAGLKALVKGQTLPGDDDDVPTGVRTLSGQGNNEAHHDYGSADTAFIRLTDAHYGAFNPATGNRDVNPMFAGLDPRNISNILSTQEAGLPKNAADGNIFFMAFGQYFDHGLDFIPKSSANGSIAIGVPGSGDDPADLTRGAVIPGTANTVPQHLNKTSAYVDQNQAYGSNTLVGQFLRESDGHRGFGSHLLQGVDDPGNPDFNLLPTLRELIKHHWDNDSIFHDDAGQAMRFRDYYPNLVVNGQITQSMVAGIAANFMGSGHALLLDTNPLINLLDHFVAGDGRANENISLTAMHTIWARNHNFHVEGLIAGGFQGTPEEIFQAAKMLNEAEYQRVVFDEFADALLGGMRGSGTHGHDGYNPNATASISHEFAAAVYRVGHSLISDTLTILGADGQPTQVTLFDAFLNPTNEASAFTVPPSAFPPGYVPKPGFEQIGANAIIGGIITQPAEEVDFNIVDSVRNDLVRIRADLAAFNIARGRDVGLGTLNQVRADLMASDDPYIKEALGYAGNLSPYTSWDDFQTRNGLSNAVIAQFKAAYPDLVLQPGQVAAFVAANPDIVLADGPNGTKIVKGIDRVDLWVGGLAETHINGGMVGQTFWIVLHEQFDRLQEADRFYYSDRFDNFDFYETFIDGQNFADIIMRNTGLTGLPEDVFSVDDEDDQASGGDDGQQDDDDTPSTGNPGDDDEPEDEDDDPPSSGGDEDDDDDESEDEDDDDSDPVTPPPSGGSALPFVVYLGTSGKDTAIGGANGDTLAGGDDDDTLFGLAGNDDLSGGSGNDYLVGGADNDTLIGNDGADTLLGGDGNDTVYGGAGDDLIEGGDGNDVITGHEGRDKINAGSGNDTVSSTIGDGNDAMDGGDGVDLLDLSALTANATVYLGVNGNGSVSSTQSGHDTIKGFENVRGGSGNDVIVASNQANVLEGGDGNDIFVFNTAAAANGDTIADFEAGDLIDLQALYASLNLTGEVSDHLTSSTAFNQAGQLHLRIDGGDTIVEGATDNDGDVDFSIRIAGRTNISGNDFA
ncbi:peroxidase family protein [Hyphomicrobium sp.]|uniref:peroxidase family protein n=1 Tax=Hyphomicrobium sp. TaxID=82 RepID=UPI002E360AA6|nr:peroxidase family protein [Hyphomicrobium sp.]HEX2842573.1 peroxidase family protein [Hyphomicrobium sp.]